MGTFPLALSVHHFISSVGADAGFAAIIGLAILVLLYFAQARETATLRDHAYEAADRIQQLEARVAQLTGGAVAEPPAQPASAAQPAPPPAPVSASSPSSSPAPSSGPVAPAGVGAPALSAATKLIPTAAPAGAVALAAGASHGSSAVEAEPTITARDERTANPAPATAAGAANGGSRAQTRAMGGSTAAPPSRVQGRPGGAPPGRRPAAPTRARQPHGGGPNRLLVGGLVAAAVAVVVVLLVILTGGGSPSKTHTTATTNAQSSHRVRQAVVNPSTVTVAVLNGTSTPGLAGSIATKLSGKGYKQGTVATASDQTATTTTVAYLPGFRRDALSVATALKVGAGSIQPVNQTAQAVACPPPAACPANVVVTVGSDLAATQ
jgi:hypothetical protein